jgi:predicted kinase
VASIRVPDPSLVVLVGAAGAGKSTFAARHFAPGDVLSSDAFRAIVSGNEADQRGTRTAFSILHREVSRRLAAGRLVVDATNVELHARRALLARAAFAEVPAVAIVLALPAAIVHARNAGRTGRIVESEIVAGHLERLAAAETSSEGSGGLFAGEGFEAVHVLRSVAEVEATRIARVPGRRARESDASPHSPT